MMNRITTAILLLTAALLSACTAASYRVSVDHSELTEGMSPRGISSWETPESSAGTTTRSTEASTPEQPAPADSRLLVYTGSLYIVVPDIARTLERVQQIAEDQGGYLASREGNAATIRVPADRFDVVRGELSALGEVTNTQMQVLDVTDQVRDLRIRLENAEAARERLTALMQRAETVEDTLKVEEQLLRLTEQIELIKGQLQAAEHQVAFATITVRLNSRVPQQSRSVATPFPWLRNLGQFMLNPQRIPGATERLGRSLAFNPPDTFVIFYREDPVLYATSATGLMLRFEHHRNLDGADTEFWATVAETTLRELAALPAERSEAIPRDRGDDAQVILADRRTTQGTQRYAAIVVGGSTRVYIVECWGPVEAFDEAWPGVRNAVADLNLR